MKKRVSIPSIVVCVGILSLIFQPYMPSASSQNYASKIGGVSPRRPFDN